MNASEVSLSRIILFASNPAKRKECVDTLLKIINDVNIFVHNIAGVGESRQSLYIVGEVPV